jgi:FADH2-dependent halogenase
VTGNLEGLRITHPRHKKLAIFGHFNGVLRDAGEANSDIIIVRLPNKWFWLIPISAEKTSVGLVIDKDEFAREKGSPHEIFDRWVESSSAVKDRMLNARRVNETRTTSDFSYYNRKLTGERLLRVGDAAGFMDPIFSAGVFLAMWSGKLAAEVVEKSLAQGKPSRRLFANYERRVKKGLMFYWRMVENYYTTPFMELFLRPTERWNLFSAVIGVLAGEVEGSWALRWRMELFFLLVKIQSRWPFSPRINFRPIVVVNKKDEVESRVISVLEEMGLEKSSIDLDARLVKDLRIASDDLSFTFIPTLEEHFKVNIPNHEWSSCSTGRDASILIKKYLHKV